MAFGHYHTIDLGLQPGEAAPIGPALTPSLADQKTAMVRVLHELYKISKDSSFLASAPRPTMGTRKRPPATILNQELTKLLTENGLFGKSPAALRPDFMQKGNVILAKIMASRPDLIGLIDNRVGSINDHGDHITSVLGLEQNELHQPAHRGALKNTHALDPSLDPDEHAPKPSVGQRPKQDIEHVGGAMNVHQPKSGLSKAVSTLESVVALPFTM